VTSESSPVSRDDRPVIAVNDRGLILGVAADGTWIVWNEDDTVRPAHTVWLAYDHLMWLMPLLQKPQDVVIEAISGADAGGRVLSEVLRYALGCWSDYWAGIALEWLEAGYPSTELRRPPGAEGLLTAIPTRASPCPPLVSHRNQLLAALRRLSDQLDHPAGTRLADLDDLTA
jgi:hypothetical protein